MIIGGNIDLTTGFSVGDKLYQPEVTAAYLNSINSYSHSMVTPGYVKWQSGKAFNGDIYYGNSASTVLGATLVKNSKCGASSELDFVSIGKSLKSSSCQFAVLPPTVQVKIVKTGSLSAMTWTLSNNTLEVVTLKASDLMTMTSLFLSGDMIDFNNPPTIIINVIGATGPVVFQDLHYVFENIFLGTRNNDNVGDHRYTFRLVDKMIWNFPDTRTLTFRDLGWTGMVLAPFADIVNSHGVLHGQIFAKSFNGYNTPNNDDFQINWIPFMGCLPGIDILIYISTSCPSEN